MTLNEKLEFISDLENQPWSESLKEAMYEVYAEPEKLHTFNTVEEAFAWLESDDD